MSTKQYNPDLKEGYRISIDETIHGVVVMDTNGTAAVNIFSGAGALSQSLTVVGVDLVSKDTTAGNITVEAPAGTVIATIAKGATSGALVGAVTLANTTIAAGVVPIVKSSTAGNASVRIYFTNPSL